MNAEKLNFMEEQLKNNLKPLFEKKEFTLHQQLIQRLSSELQVNTLDLAAALSLLKQPELLQKPAKLASSTEISPQKQKLVRYRIDIGKKHSASVDEIKSVLIEVSGVDKNRIGRLDIRNHYSLIDLPEGMPADIFQLLAEVEVNNQKLNLKRMKYQPRFYRRKSKR